MSEERDPNQQPIQIQQPDMPMNWHSFLVKCGLWGAAAVLLIEAVLMFTGGAGEAGGVRAVFFCVGAVCVLSAYVQLRARSSLAAFRANGPKLLQVGAVLFFLCFVASLLTSAVLPTVAQGGSAPGTWRDRLSGTALYVGAGVVIGLCQLRYYNKRDHLFTN